MNSARVLFIGKGTHPICYYRAMLPAMALGADWIGAYGDPPDMAVATGIVQGKTAKPNMREYDIVVIQQPSGEGWLETIKSLQEDSSVKVLYEIDDYLHGIAEMEDHGFKDKFMPQDLFEYEKCMRQADGLIASTEYILGKYRKFNPNGFLCQNGLDLKRYDLKRPSRDTVNIGWAGGTGHYDAVLPWFRMVSGIMEMKDNTTFISIGQNYADGFARNLGQERAISVPWCAIEQYPAAMTMFDIALAPAGKGGFFRGKSDLRWLEAGALGIPCIANPRVYKEVEHEVTGFTAVNPQQMAEYLVALVEDASLRDRVGRAAQEYVRDRRSIQAVAPQWVKAFELV